MDSFDVKIKNFALKKRIFCINKEGWYAKIIVRKKINNK